MSTTTTTTRTITLSGRPPVRIVEADWPIIARADDSDEDGVVPSQANITSAWSVRVRRHADGRAIIYATYSYSTCYQGKRNLSAKRGAILPTGSSSDDICRAIGEVCESIERAEHADDDSARWASLAHECIADMPAQTI